MSESVVVVRLEHLRMLRYCVRGTKLFFCAHGIDWKKFCREGVTPEELEATGDAMAIRLAMVARNGR